jgi:CHRD domain
MLCRAAWCCALASVLAAATGCSSPSTSPSASSTPNTSAAGAATIHANLTPPSAHAMDIHPGTCAAQNQPPSVPFPDITADSAGAVVHQTVTSTPAPAGIPNGALSIHLAPSSELGRPGQLGYTPIACADIPAATPAAGPVTLPLRAAPTNQTTPAGTVTLTYDPTHHSLHVDLTATGLPAKSAHTAHIHSGACTAQGPVVHPLPDLQADGHGSASLSKSIDKVTQPPPPTGLYVNVHRGPAAEILDNNQPTLLFAPILCANVTH